MNVIIIVIVFDRSLFKRVCKKKIETNTKLFLFIQRLKSSLEEEQETAEEKEKEGEEGKEKIRRVEIL